MKTENLFELGFSRLDAPFAAREKAAVAQAALPEELELILRGCPAGEAVLLSTCSRLELYGVAQDPRAALERAREWLRERGGAGLEPHLEARTGAEALRHLFRVAAGLESWIVGESEILGQVKRAYDAARAAGFTGPVLNRAFQSAAAAGKAARARTGIQNGVHSIGGAAALLARGIFGAGDGDVIVFGAGEAAEAAVRHLLAKSMRRVLIANRTLENAAALASRVGGQALSFEEGLERLGGADIAIFSTASPSFVLSERGLRRLMPRRKPLFLIDLGMPRNVEPACGALPDVFLYGLADLKDVVARSLEAKAPEILKAKELVDRAAAACAAELEKAEALRAPREAAV